MSEFSLFDLFNAIFIIGSKQAIGTEQSEEHHSDDGDDDDESNNNNTAVLSE